MKILNVFYNFEQGGVERLGISVANCLAESGEDSYVCIINDQRDDALLKLFSDEVKLILLNKKRKFRKINYIKQLVSVIKKEKIQVLHVHQGTLMNFFLIIKLLCPKVKIVFTIHDTFIYSNLANKNKKIANRICYKLVAISEGVVNDMKNHGAPMKKVVRIYNGVNFDKFVCRENNIVNSTPVIVNVARFFPEKKGQDVLIHAVADLQKKGINVKVKFAGGELNPGDNKIEQMRLLARELDVEHNIDFLGNVSDVNKLLEEANIFCIPSNYEGFGISAVEAMGTGLPVVASDIVGLNEVVNSKKLGLLFEAGNHIDLANKLGMVLKNLNEYNPDIISQDVRDRFSIKKMIRELINAYM